MFEVFLCYMCPDLTSFYKFFSHLFCGGSLESCASLVIICLNLRKQVGSVCNSFSCAKSFAPATSRTSSRMRSHPSTLRTPMPVYTIRVWSYATFIVIEAMINRYQAVET